MHDLTLLKHLNAAFDLNGVALRCRVVARVRVHCCCTLKLTLNNTFFSNLYHNKQYAIKGDEEKCTTNHVGCSGPRTWPKLALLPSFNSH